MKSISLIINTYNRRAFLERTLASLSYLHYPELEVICVNGPSNDGTAELLENYRGKVKLASCPEANLSLSRNIGIQAASGELVCFIDDDAVPEPGWLDALAAAFDHDKTAAAGGFIRDYSGVAWQDRFVICDRFGGSFKFGRREDIIINGLKPEEWGSDYYTALTGTNVCFRRDILVKLGGFDEAYAYFLDETDVLIRLVDAGYELVQIEGAEVHHKFAPSHLWNGKNAPRYLYHPMRSRAYFTWRHALERYGGVRCHAELRKQALMAEAGVIWHFSNKNIDDEQRDILLKDIRRGLTDGLEMAFRVNAPYTRPVSFFASPPAFLPFPRPLPAEQRLRLCIISQDYLPNPNGGIGVWVSELARGLAGRGHEISVITRAAEKFDTVDFEEGVWVHRIVQRYFPERPYAAPADLPQLVYDWAASAYRELIRINLIRGVDSALAPVWDVEGIVAHCENTIPVVLSLHTSYSLALPSKPQWREIPGYLQNHVEPIIRTEKLLWNEAPLVIANSRAIVRDLAASYGGTVEEKRLALVPHGLEDSSATPEESSFNKSAGGESCRVLFVGRFEERKGIDVLLECIPGIAEKYPETVFELVGAKGITPFWADFQKKWEREPWFGRISAPGFVSPGDLAAAYASCDIFVAPSRYESFGLIYLEAMMRGKPCIGSDAGGIPEVVRCGENGFTPPAGDAAALRSALVTLIENKELREAMGKKGREIFEKDYTRECMVTGIETALFAMKKECTW